jgi:hypothetical protein
MTNTQERERDESAEKQAREDRRTLIGKRVIHILGQPEGLQAVQVRALWQNHYRVNVFVGPDVISSKIVHSYFVESDIDGNIVKSTPKITS